MAIRDALGREAFAATATGEGLVLVTALTRESDLPPDEARIFAAQLNDAADKVDPPDEGPEED